MSELSVITLCLSTLEPLPRFIDNIARYLMANPSDIDLVMVINKTAEDPEAIIEYARKQYPWLKLVMLQRNGGGRRSYGALVRFGIAYSTSRYVVLVSPYGEDDLSIIPEMLRKIRQGVQVVQAVRYSSTEDADKVPFKFRLYQEIYRFLTKIFLGFLINDSTYGFKMFDRAFIQALGLNQNGYSLSPEITLKALLAGGKVEYISSRMQEVPPHRDFKLYREGLGYLWLLVRGFGHRINILWF